MDRIAYDSIETDIGRLWVAASPDGLLRVDFDRPEEEFLGDLRRVHHVEPERDPEGVREARTQLLEYLGGRRTAFDLKLDLRGVTPFQAQLLLACASIPYGETRSYGELARQAGRPGAARAVGSVMARNPIPLVIPCHRVVRSGGALGGFGGGLDVKGHLLRLEAGHVEK